MAALHPLIPPFNFATVEAGIYRGAYPTLPNFRFLRRYVWSSAIAFQIEPGAERMGPCHGSFPGWAWSPWLP